MFFVHHGEVIPRGDVRSWEEDRSFSVRTLSNVADVVSVTCGSGKRTRPLARNRRAECVSSDVRKEFVRLVA